MELLDRTIHYIEISIQKNFLYTKKFHSRISGCKKFCVLFYYRSPRTFVRGGTAEAFGADGLTKYPSFVFVTLIGYSR